jgi:hypothetical protein
MKLCKRRLPEMEVIKIQSFITDGDHLDRMQRETELVKWSRRLMTNNGEEDQKKKGNKCSSCIADNSLKKLIEHRRSKEGRHQKHIISAILLKLCDICLNSNNESKTSLVDKLNIEQAKGRIPGFAAAAPGPAFPVFLPRRNSSRAATSNPVCKA